MSTDEERKIKQERRLRIFKEVEEEIAKTPSLVKYTRDLLTLVMDEYVGYPRMVVGIEELP